MKNELTPLAKEFYRLAKNAGLENPKGRALALVNRSYNTSLFFHNKHNINDVFCEGNYLECTCNPQKGMDALHLLVKIKPETASRWLKHWNSGGSLKGLNHMRKQ